MSIILEVDEGDGQALHYEAQNNVTIGRDPRVANVLLKDEFVSRIHCIIQRRKNGEWSLMHRGKNPSRLDEDLLDTPGAQRPLTGRGTLFIGKVRVKYLVDEEAVTEIMSREVLTDSPDLDRSHLDRTQLEDSKPKGPDDDDEEDYDERLMGETQLDTSIPSAGGLDRADGQGYDDTSARSTRPQPYPLHDPPPPLDHEASLEAPIPKAAPSTEVAFETLDLSDAQRKLQPVQLLPRRNQGLLAEVFAFFRRLFARA
ncbi:MAG: FHA domain-containing protein [Myxococcota bacterium]